MVDLVSPDFHALAGRAKDLGSAAVFLLLAAGRAPKQVAAELGIGQKTVYIHRASLMGKLGAGSELDLYRMASERGLLDTARN